MEKFLSWTDSDGKTTLISVDNIIGIRGSSIRIIYIYQNVVGFDFRDLEVLSWQLVAPSAITTEAVNAQLNAVADAIEDLLSSKHKDRILSLNNRLPYPVTLVSQEELDWSNNSP